MSNYAVEAENTVLPWELDLCTRALRSLERHYPGYDWRAESYGCAIMVRNSTFSHGNKPWGFFLHIGRLPPGGIEHAAKMAGGELLERWNRRATGINREAEIERGYSRYFEKPQT